MQPKHCDPDFDDIITQPCSGRAGRKRDMEDLLFFVSVKMANWNSSSRVLNAACLLLRTSGEVIENLWFHPSPIYNCQLLDIGLL